jgi:hypothetical protein
MTPKTAEPQRKVGLSVLSLVIGLCAIGAFVFLNRMMAPPFPNFGVSPTAALSNAIAQANMKTNATVSPATNGPMASPPR